MAENKNKIRQILNVLMLCAVLVPSVALALGSSADYQVVDFLNSEARQSGSLNYQLNGSVDYYGGVSTSKNYQACTGDFAVLQGCLPEANAAGGGGGGGGGTGAGSNYPEHTDCTGVDCVTNNPSPHTILDITPGTTVPSSGTSPVLNFQTGVTETSVSNVAVLKRVSSAATTLAVKMVEGLVCKINVCTESNFIGQPVSNANVAACYDVGATSESSGQAFLYGSFAYIENCRDFYWLGLFALLLVILIMFMPINKKLKDRLKRNLK